MFKVSSLFGRSVILACVFALPGMAQTPTPTPTPVVKASTTHKPASNILKDLAADQKAIWTSPFHIERSDWKWLGPLMGGTAALIATDKTTSGWVSRNGSLPRVSRDVSLGGGIYGTVGIAGGMWAIGSWSNNEHLRETGRLASEALADTEIVTEAAKYTFGRQRPNEGNSEGEFFRRGRSFFSGHSSATWSVATVVACEYHDHPLAVWGAYGLATAVSLSRYTGRNHFLSDIFVGAAVGYGIGRYVCGKRASYAEGEDDNTVSRRWRISPYLNARSGTMGGSFHWQF